MTWYDRNANGRRDSNINVIGMSADVEFTHGVGGVSVQLVECDGGTGRCVFVVVVVVVVVVGESRSCFLVLFLVGGML